MLQSAPADCPALDGSSTGQPEEGCFNGVPDSDEADMDCGGICAALCANGLDCDAPADCESGICSEGTCTPAASCDDGVQNDGESDQDCGGVCGATCPIDASCEDFLDCATYVCDADAGQCAAPSCDDAAPNGAETDVDCGGPDCDPCRNGGACEMDSDCASAACDEGQCVAPTCTDGEQGQSETDVDCGGPDCAPCGDGQSCEDGSDCASAACDAGACATGSCDDGLKNGRETDVDCGGSDCDPCEDGLECLIPEDCMSQSCDPEFQVCEAESCTNGILDGDESDIDCGGPSCAPCHDGDTCESPSDCASESCEGSTCVAPSCSDGVHNGNESDVDCGGDTCGPCGDGESCLLMTDCTSSVCLSEVCQIPTCDDAVLNGDESDEDCGGSCSANCIDGDNCGADTDCVSGVCGDDGTCSAPTCEDNTRNGNETDVDCGGPGCAPCEAPGMCEEDTDCVSSVCDDGTCAPASCRDSVLNGDETDIDCGGEACGPCADGETCIDPDDCGSLVCTGGSCIPATCDDGVRNSDETDTDCGGETCDACADGETCAVAADCVSVVCDPVALVCEAATCNDGVLNGTETDEDCGGDSCSGCDTAETCDVNGDCISLSCDDGSSACLAPTCDDGIANQDETDVDCGGDTCDPCVTTQSCVDADDCVSMVCLALVCQASECDDSVQNGDETDNDCGGSCQPCDDTEGCAVAADCISGICDPGLETCTPATCSDGVQNQGETDTDCGGANCGATCGTTESCDGAGDCTSGGCTAGACNPPLSITINPNACGDASLGPVIYTAAGVGGTGGPYTYAWSPDDGTVSFPNSATTSVNPPDYASYEIAVNDGLNTEIEVGVVVYSAQPFNLQNNCSLYQAAFGGSNPASITYSAGGTVATEGGNNAMGLHVCEDVSFTNVRLTGQAIVNTTNDDDMFGLIWGAQDSSNFYVMSWKQGSQNFFNCSGGNTPEGMMIKRVFAPDFASITGADMYCPNDTTNSEYLMTPAETISSGWLDNTLYSMEIEYRRTGSTITVTNEASSTEVASFVMSDTTYTSGYFGSHTVSQDDVSVGPLIGQCL